MLHRGVTGHRQAPAVRRPVRVLFAVALVAVVAATTAVVAPLPGGASPVDPPFDPTAARPAGTDDPPTPVSTSALPPPSVDAPPAVVAAPVPDEALPGPAPLSPVRLVRPMVFPVLGAVRFADGWGDCRDDDRRDADPCPRLHEGTDLMGTLRQPLLAAVDGTVTAVVEGDRRGGHGLVVTDARGWRYGYWHLDDRPGPGGPWAVADGIAEGVEVRAGQVIGFLGDSGNARGAPHLHFELRRADGTPVNPFPSLVAAERAGRCRPPAPNSARDPTADLDDLAWVPWVKVRSTIGEGDWVLTRDGRVLASGDGLTIGRPEVRLRCPG